MFFMRLVVAPRRRFAAARIPAWRSWAVRGSWWLAALAIGTASVAAAQVSGKLVLGSFKPAAAAAPDPKARPEFFWELENGFKEVRADRIDPRRELAVVLVGEGEPMPGIDRIEVAFSGGGLLPSTIVMRAGSTVLFRNDDEFAHELYADGLEELVAEGTSPRGRRSVSPKGPGSWKLHDRAVGHLEGQLTVLPDLLAIAQVQADGSYTFGEIKPGKYTLKVFRADKELASQAIEVDSHDLTVDPLTLTESPSAK